MIVNRKGQRGISDYSRRGFLAGKGLIGMEGCVCHIMHLFEGACFLCSWASKTDGLHDPAHAIPAVAGCSDCLLDTFLDTLGVHPDLCNAVPAFSILTDSVVWFTFGLHRRQFAEDVFNAILVNLKKRKKYF